MIDLSLSLCPIDLLSAVALAGAPLLTSTGVELYHRFEIRSMI
jgi:hypothetical protein